MWHNGGGKKAKIHCLLCAKHIKRKNHLFLFLVFPHRGTAISEHSWPFCDPLLMTYLIGKLMQEPSNVVQYPPSSFAWEPFILVCSLLHRFFKDRPLDRWVQDCSGCLGLGKHTSLAADGTTLAPARPLPTSSVASLRSCRLSPHLDSAVESHCCQTSKPQSVTSFISSNCHFDFYQLLSHYMS